MKGLAVVAVLAVAAVGLSAGPATGGASASGPGQGLPALPESPPATERSSALLAGGQVRCTATVQAAVAVGDSLSVGFALHNISKSAAQVTLWPLDPYLVLKAADGTVYDTRAPLMGWPMVTSAPITIRPGATLQAGPVVIPGVRWRGPLRITPGCSGKTLPTLDVRVLALAPPPDKSAAVAAVVAATGHLLDHCAPQTSGAAVEGQIDPPSGTAPPMDATCSVSISPEGDFWVAQALIVIPRDLPDVQVYQPYETLWPLTGPPMPTTSPPHEVIAWEFVLTGIRVIPVAAAEEAASEATGQMAPFWGWDGTGWQSMGTGSCGGEGFGFGGPGPIIEFISACAYPQPARPGH
jgi:hypothetical protein